jgi:hypothetical protein
MPACGLRSPVFDLRVPGSVFRSGIFRFRRDPLIGEAGFRPAGCCPTTLGRVRLGVRSGAWLSGRAFASHARGRWFDSTRAHHFQHSRERPRGDAINHTNRWHTHKEDSPKTALFVASSVGDKRRLRGLLDRGQERLQHRRVLLVARGEHFPVGVLRQLATLTVEGDARA